MCICMYILRSQRGDLGHIRSSSMSPRHTGLPLRAPYRRVLGKELGAGPHYLPRTGTNGGVPDPGLTDGCVLACSAGDGAPGDVPNPSVPGLGLAAG